MRVLLLLLLLLLLSCPAVIATLQLNVYGNTALAPPAVSHRQVPTLDVTLHDLSRPFSTEVSGSLNPQPLPDGQQPRWRFECTFTNISVGWLWLDNHCICQHGAYNNSANGVFDGNDLRLLRKRTGLTLRMHLTRSTAGSSAGVAVRWCPLGHTGKTVGACTAIPGSVLSPQVSAPERARVAMQRNLSTGWGSWLFRDLSSVVFLPDSAVITPYICQISSGTCLSQVQQKGGGGADEDSAGINSSSIWGSRVRVGAKSPDSTFAEMSYLFETTAAGDGLNITLMYAAADGSDAKRNQALDLLVSAKPLVAPGSSVVCNMSDYLVALTGSFAWGRLGTANKTATGLWMKGYGLAPLELSATADAMVSVPEYSGRRPMFLAQGALYGSGCKRDGDCASLECVGKNEPMPQVPSTLLVPCSNTDPSQRWTIAESTAAIVEGVATGHFLRNNATNSCLSFWGGSRGVGPCDTSATRWMHNSPNALELEANGPFAGQCLDADGGKPGANVDLYLCHALSASDLKNQQWQFVSGHAGDQMVIKNVGTQQCLAARRIGKTLQATCSQPREHAHYVVQLSASLTRVGITTRGMSAATLDAISSRIALAAKEQQKRHRRFGAANEAVAEAVTSAVGWRTIYCPAEAGPVLPVTYGFTWITPGAQTDDWNYIMFDWDNIFGSLITGVLGYKEVAFSNLIQIVTAKASTGYVPDWAAGGSKIANSEPQVGGRVLWELYRRFPKETWVIELLLDDLLDWHDWAWDRRRVIGENGTRCELPGFLTLGNDDCERLLGHPGNCSDLSSGPDNMKSSCQGESGQDQSPLWDCPDANVSAVSGGGSGGGGDCARLIDNATWTAAEGSEALRGALSMHVMQLGDVQSTTLYVNEAHSLARLARVVNRTDVASTLESRAAIMTTQLHRLWSEDDGCFNDVYCQNSTDGTQGRTHSERLTPNIFYPLMIPNASTVSQAETLVTRHLLNASEFCIASDWETDASELPDNCYWGLPSIAAADPSYMKPPSYIYWRGYNWGPMTLLTWWGLDGMSSLSPVVKAARTALATQKTAAMMDIWRRHRHICENYPMYRPGTVPLSVCGLDQNGKQRNCMGSNSTECTGGHQYHWGALNGLVTLMETEGLAPPFEARE